MRWISHDGNVPPRLATKPIGKTEKVIRSPFFCFIGGIAFIFAFDFCYLAWHTHKCAIFCRKVASLPQEDLAVYASRCDALLATNTQSLISTRDKGTLNQFVLLGKTPELIDIFPRRVTVHYLGVQRLAARIDWQDYSQWGDPTWKLTGTPCDTTGYIVIYQRKK